MKKIGDLGQSANHALRNGQQQPEKNMKAGMVSARLMVNLWERMTHFYGHKWTSVYGESAVNGEHLTDAAQTWASGLSGVSGWMIANGFRECVKSGDQWPPALPAFVKLCNGEKKDWQLQGLSLKNPENTLPAPKLPKDEVARRVAGLKDVIKKYRGPVVQQEASEPFVSDPERRKELEEEFKELGFLPKES